MARTLQVQNKAPRIYYGYVILAAAFFIMVLTYGSQGSFGVFLKPMLTDFGWTRAATAGPYALLMLVSGVCTIISGRLSDRFGPRIVVTAGALILGAGYILTSRITELWQLYLTYGVLVAAGTSAMYVPPVTLISRWFTRRRGLMSGIGIAGIGLGIGIMPAIASQIVVSLDWRASLLIVGGTSMVGILGLARLLKNEAPDHEQSRPPVMTPRSLEKEGFTFKQAAKTRQFWMIFIAWVFYGFFFQVGIVHSVPYATDLGMTAVAAATVLTVIGIVGTVGRIGIGLVGDRIGNRTTVCAAYGIVTAGYVGLAFSHSVGMLYVFAVIFGALSGIGILLIPFIAEYFGFKELGLISGTIVFSNSAGGAISPPLAGAIFDATGSYQWAFILCAILGFLAFMIILRLRPIRKA
jgi:MFS family permease